MENQVFSLPLCKRFKELGIEIKTKFVYVVMNTFSKTENIPPRILVTTDSLVLESMCWYKKEESNNYEEHYPAPTLSELLEIVPVLNDHEFSLGKQSNVTSTWYYTEYRNIEEILFLRAYDSPIEAVGKLIIYLKENNLIQYL